MDEPRPRSDYKAFKNLHVIRKQFRSISKETQSTVKGEGATRANADSHTIHLTMKWRSDTSHVKATALRSHDPGFSKLVGAVAHQIRIHSTNPSESSRTDN